MGGRSMRKILLVEDHTSFRQALKNIIQLENPSTVIEEAADGKEALQKVDALHPDLIIMDIGLPGESGLQITTKIRKNYPGIIIAVLTSYDEESDREAAFECGANYFISKNDLNWNEIEGLIKSLSSHSSSLT